MGKSIEAIKDLMESKDISWFDYNKLSHSEKLVYYSGVKDLLRSKVLENEVNKYIEEVIKEIVYLSEDYKKVENLRYSINGIKALMERLEEIPNPEQEVVVENPNSAI